MRRFLCVIGFMIGCEAFAAEPTIAVTAQQRYPWNGMVDISFTITGDSGVKYDTSFVAKDVSGGTNLAMKTVYKSDGSAVALTNALAAGSYKWVWNASADLPSGFVGDRMSVVGNLIISDADKKRYMVVTLSNGNIQYLQEPPTSGWTDDPYKQTKWAFQRIEAGTFTQTSGTGDSRQVTISKPFYVSLTPFTSYHGRSIGSRYSSDQVLLPDKGDDDDWYAWPYVTVVVRMGDWPGRGNHRTLLDWLEDDSYSTATVVLLNSKTKKTFMVPTEAQLTLARKSINIGSTWLFTRDHWQSSLGSSAVKDPCSAGGTYVGQYIPMTCVTQSSRSYVYAFENGAGNEVALRLCCPAD